MALELLTDDERFTVIDKALAGVTDGDEDTSYTLRKITPAAHRTIVKKHTKPAFERGVGRVEKVDSLAVFDDVLDYVIEGWSGVLLKGAPAPCTRELKIAGLDFTRKQALVDLAGMNEIARGPERRAESFRATDDVPAVLGR